jgi:hypothetical protein
MQHYLESIASPWVAPITVTSPLYRDIEVDFEVRYLAHVNPDYGRRSLWEALTRRYMPWTSDIGGAVSIGGDLDYYAMVGFMQKLDFVEHVTALTLYGAKKTVKNIGIEAFILKPSESLQSIGVNRTRR